MRNNLPKRGADEQTLEVRAVEITGDHIGDGEGERHRFKRIANVLPDLLSQIPADEEIAKVTARQDTDVVILAQGSEDLGAFVAALEAADLVEPQKGDGPYTVFAPSNAAFDAQPAGTLDDLLKEENRDRLVSIMTYHVPVLGHRTAAAGLTDGMRSDTLNGARVRVSNDGTVVMVDDPTVVQADRQTSNGIVHVIDAVLPLPGRAFPRRPTIGRAGRWVLSAIAGLHSQHASCIIGKRSSFLSVEGGPP